MPSRKIISIFIVAVALVVGIILGFGKNSSIGVVKEIANAGALSKGPEVKIPENKNWLADLSPLALNQVEVSSVQASSTQNLTAQVSESLIANYLSLRQSGNLNDTSAFELVNQAAAFTESGATSAKTYTTADILISPDNSQAAIRKYGSELGNILKIYNSPTAKNEAALFVEIVRSKDPQMLSALNDTAEVYFQMNSSLKKIKVPSSYTAMHLSMLNNLSKVAHSVEDFSLVFEDPLKSLSAITSYETGAMDFALTLNQIRTKIIKDGVDYKQGESGYYLYYGI